MQQILQLALEVQDGRMQVLKVVWQEPAQCSRLTNGVTPFLSRKRPALTRKSTTGAHTSFVLMLQVCDFLVVRLCVLLL